MGPKEGYWGLQAGELVVREVIFSNIIPVIVLKHCICLKQIVTGPRRLIVAQSDFDVLL